MKTPPTQGQLTALLDGAVKYTDCTSADGKDHHPINALGITLNCIEWWDSSPRALGKMEYPFIAISDSFTLIWIGCTY